MLLPMDSMAPRPQSEGEASSATNTTSTATTPVVDHIIDSLVKAREAQDHQEDHRQHDFANDSDQDMDDMIKVLTDLQQDIVDNNEEGVGQGVDDGDPMAKNEEAGHEQDDRLSLERQCEQLNTRHLELGRRYECLRRRIARVRVRQLNAHSTQQLALLRSHCTPNDSPSATSAPTTSPTTTTTTKATTTTSSRVPTKSRRASASTTAASSMPTMSPLELSSSSKHRVVDTLGQLESNLNQLRTDYDSEATESSSGGESADEIDYGGNSGSAVTYYTSVKKRAKYVWLSRRAEIASRWTWLTAQIADLEYKVRQQTDLYRHIRANKGNVQLGEAIVSWPPHAKKPVLAASTASLPLNCQPVTKNYCRIKNDHLISSSPTSNEASLVNNNNNNNDDDDEGCSRIRPLKELRRRKVIRIDHQRQQSSGAIEKPTLPGQDDHRFGGDCDVDYDSSFSLCSTTPNPLQGLRPDPLASEEENVALLDHSYHKVLSSSPRDVRLSLSINSALNTKRVWLPTSELKDRGHEESKINDKLYPKQDSINEKSSAKRSTSTTSSASASKRRSSKNSLKDRKGRRKSLSVFNSSDDRTPTMHDFDADEATCSSQMSTQAWAEHIKRRRGTAFDINNIVIPYSIAATTRVEKLKYKEILTPTWRIIKPKVTPTESEVCSDAKTVLNNGLPIKVMSTKISPATTAVDDEHETMTDETFERRHCRAELEERKRWQLPTALNKNSNSNRSQRRQDSCQTSSGTNTPADIPSSPAPMESNHEITTRPPTPTSMGNDDSNHSSVGGSITKRRRTTSSSASRSRDRNPSSEETTVGNNESGNNSISHEASQFASKPSANAYELRRFPLSDFELKTMSEETRPEVNGVNGTSEKVDEVQKKNNKRGVSWRSSSSSVESMEESTPFLLVDEETLDEEEESDWNDDPDDPEWNASESKLESIIGNHQDGINSGRGVKLRVNEDKSNNNKKPQQSQS